MIWKFVHVIISTIQSMLQILILVIFLLGEKLYENKSVYDISYKTSTCKTIAY